jgi:hypothetical protein
MSSSSSSSSSSSQSSVVGNHEEIIHCLIKSWHMYSNRKFHTHTLFFGPSKVGKTYLKPVIMSSSSSSSSSSQSSVVGNHEETLTALLNTSSGATIDWDAVHTYLNQRELMHRTPRANIDPAKHHIPAIEFLEEAPPSMLS